MDRKIKEIHARFNTKRYFKTGDNTTTHFLRIYMIQRMEY